MKRASIGLHDLRRRIYVKAKAEPSWRFWGLYAHVCKQETLREAYLLARQNNGAPGVDGVTFDAIEQSGIEAYLSEIREELVAKTYYPSPVRKKAIPKGNGKSRELSIPTIRDRIVQGALKLILEPIFEADFKSGSFGYRPKKAARQAVARVGKAIAQGKTSVIDLDLKSYFDNVRHSVLLERVARRIEDDDILRVVKQILKSTGKRGVAQGGVISPLLSNLYLNEVDGMLERAKDVTRRNGHINVEYARFADDLVVLVDGHPRHSGLLQVILKRLKDEFGVLGVAVNEEKSRVVDLARGEAFSFLGFRFRRAKSRRGKWCPRFTPEMKKRTALLEKLRAIFKRFRSQPIQWVVVLINPILRGWANYFRIGHSARCFSYVRNWVEEKVRRHLMRNMKRRGCGWKRWSRGWLYDTLGLYQDYEVRYAQAA